MLLQNFAYTLIPAQMKLILDETVTTNRFSFVRHHLWIIGLYVLLMAVSLFMMRKLIIGVSRKIEFELRENIYDKILSLDYLFFQANETGDLISRCTNDLNDVRTLLGPGIMYVPNALSRLILFLPVLIGLSGKLVLIIVSIMALLVTMIIVILPRLRPLFLRIQEMVASINNRVWQIISGILTIKLNSLETIETHRFRDLNQQYVKENMRLVKYREGLWPFFLFLFSLIELIILLVGGRQVINGQMTIGQLLQFSVMVAYLTFPILSLGWIMALMQQGISAMTRINYILDEPITQTTPSDTIENEDITISVRNLTYTYPNGDTPSLMGLSLTIRPNQIVGITGKIGCGKSTLLLILTGMLKPDRGTVFINGRDICDLDPVEWNSRLAVVSQDPFLFSRSVAGNINMGSNDSLAQEAIEAAANSAGLKEEIASFPNGFDQLVGERGITLSGGQKQRLAIARAIGRCAPILILDDPLSNLDSKTESGIIDNLKTGHCYQSLILVSHRISALKQAEVIYVLDEGRLIEEGNHRELVKNRGLYAKLARLQRLETIVETK